MTSIWRHSFYRHQIRRLCH